MWGAPQGNVYLAPGVTDMRKSINTLALMVVEMLGMEPVGPHWFVFCGRKRDKLKILQWDTNGFWLHYRRLEQGRFVGPRDAQDQAALQVTARQLRWLLDCLPAEVRAYILEREQHIAAREQHIAELEQRIDVLEEQFRLAQLKRFAPSCEKYGLQGCLFNEAESSAQAAPEDSDDQTESADAAEMADDPATPGKKRGRKRLPAHLKRVRVEHDLPDADRVCSCCHGALHRMGEDVTEQLHIVPAQVSVLQHVRFQYACRHCEQHALACRIVTSPMPAQPIPVSGRRKAPPACGSTAVPTTAHNRWCCLTISRGADTRRLPRPALESAVSSPSLWPMTWAQ
jgi:transposase